MDDFLESILKEFDDVIPLPDTPPPLSRDGFYNKMKKKCNIKESFIGLVFLAGRSIFERGRWGVEIIVLARSCCRFIDNSTCKL